MFGLLFSNWIKINQNIKQVQGKLEEKIIRNLQIN